MLRDPFNVWASWRDMERLRHEMGWLFDWSGRTYSTAETGYPTMNVWTNEDGAIVTAELTGIDQEELDITVRGNTLTVRGIRHPVELQEGEAYHRRERGYGKFQREFQLPFHVDASGVEASYKNGVLRILLPRAESDKPRKISVTAA